MKLDCLDCLLAVNRRLDEKRRAQDLVLSNGQDKDSLQQAQYFEGEIAALEFVKKAMNKALNREVK